MEFADKIKAANSKNSFMLHNGIRLTGMEQDYARVEADLCRENRNLYGAVHGGMFLTMADCAAGAAARTNGMRYVTVSSSFEFYRNTQDSHLIAEGRIKNRGKPSALPRWRRTTVEESFCAAALLPSSAPVNGTSFPGHDGLSLV